MLFSILLLLVLPARSQTPACKWLTHEEAVSVLGSNTRLIGFSSGCQFTSGKLSLNVIQPVSIPEKRMLDVAFETMKGDKHGKAEPGLGDRAFHAVAGGEVLLTVVKSEVMFGLELSGQGAGASYLPKLRKAARQMLLHLKIK